jgi:hypothetical protein
MMRYTQSASVDVEVNEGFDHGRAHQSLEASQADHVLYSAQLVVILNPESIRGEGSCTDWRR